mmetsp:Transcript_3817/g.10015  ORF Transcript_3817/g.10015 Transcript_3817/m.10015 type:complete len:696 (+) Transcript_3817:114-2201(+)
MRPLSVAVFLICFEEQLQLSSSSKSSVNGNDDEDLCGMYLAPSTIPGAGLGVFAGHTDISKGDYLLSDDGDLVVPVYEMTKHIGHTNYSFLWEEYTWKAASYPGMREEVDDVQTVKACSTGLGAAVNCILPLVNIKDDYDTRQMGLSGIVVHSGGYENSTFPPLRLPSIFSPGVGAFTPYFNRRWKAKRDIPAGMELYGNYGQAYFKSRSRYNKVPLKKNYKQIDSLLEKFQTITKDEKKATRQERSDLLVYLQSLSTIWNDSRNMHAIPQTEPPGDARVVDWLLDQDGGSGMIHYNHSIRDLSWLQEYGRCMDNIRDGISHIPHAGRGAFARRFMPKGTIVAPAPLIQIPDRSVFTIYDKKIVTSKDGGYRFVTDLDKPIHQQLLLNYCFGHRESTLLLCPYGLMTSHINHDRANPNTKIVWATDEEMAHPEWKKKSITKWGTKDEAGLSFNFVALRNIQRDEEITIDYGSEWEEQWQKHLQSFNTENEGDIQGLGTTDAHFVPAYELNNMIDLNVQTMEEGDHERQGLRLFCRKLYLGWSAVEIPISNSDNEGKKDIDQSDQEVYPCRIRTRYRRTSNEDKIETHHDYRYLAEIFERTEVSSQSQHSDEKKTENVSPNDDNKTQEYIRGLLFDVPRDAFYFKDKENYRHHHQVWSFRHDMRIPDEIFPDLWKNNKKRDSNSNLYTNPKTNKDE